MEEGKKKAVKRTSEQTEKKGKKRNKETVQVCKYVMPVDYDTTHVSKFSKKLYR